MILFCDYDNTLHPRNNEETFLRNLKAVQKFRSLGNYFVLATGRSLQSLKRNFPDYPEYLDYAILDNGSIVLDAHLGQDSVLFKTEIEKRLAEEITTEIKKFTQKKNCEVYFVYYYGFDEGPELNSDITKLRAWLVGDLGSDELKDHLSTILKDRVKIHAAHGAVPSSLPYLKNINSTEFVDIMPLDAGKDMAIERLIDNYLGKNQRVTAIGDDTNDDAMIARYNGYAIADGYPGTVALAKPDHIVKTVAELIEKLIAKK